MARRDFDASPVTPSHPMELLVGDQRSDGNRIRFPPSRPGGESFRVSVNLVVPQAADARRRSREKTSPGGIKTRDQNSCASRG